MKGYPNGNMTRTQVINFLIKKFSYKSYLEIGTRNVNDNYNKILIKYKECIDPNPAVGKMTYRMTSDDAFKVIKETGKKYDIIFIDGLHLSEQVDKDIKNSLDVLNMGGTIVLHDCNPILKYHTRSYQEYLKHRGHWNGTVWRSIVKLRTEQPDLYICVVDTDWGCGIIKRGKQILHTPKDGDIFSYEYLDKYRKELMNLISVAEFKKLKF